MRHIKNIIRVYLFLMDVKRWGGISSNWLSGKPHCAKWQNKYAGFLNRKEVSMFHAMVRLKKLKGKESFYLGDRYGKTSVSISIYI